MEKLFYVQIEQTAVWNIQVSAETEQEAEEKAIGELAFVKEDYLLNPEITLCEEVQKTHE